LKEVEVAPRADKVTVSVAVRAAFEDLLEARRALGDLEGLAARSQRLLSASDGS
jgi:hypothetical protein